MQEMTHIRSTLNGRRTRTAPRSVSDVILGSGEGAALGHLRAQVSSAGPSCQWEAFARVSDVYLAHTWHKNGIV